MWPGTWIAEIDIYLDPAWTNGSGFDYSVGSTGTDGGHLRDFIFHVTKDTSSGKLWIAGSNNTNFAPREDLDTLANHYEVTTAGWYTLQHRFYQQGNALAVDLNLLNANGEWLWTETRTNSSDTIPDVVGGNRYSWFTFIKDITVAVDNHQLIFPSSTVTPGSSEWIFSDDDYPGGTGELAWGPATPPLGIGSAHFVVDGTERIIYGTAAYAGTRLADISALEYSTYQASTDGSTAVSLQFDIDYDPNDSIIGWQGRLAYEPYMSGTVLQGQWQAWSPLNGLWWSSKPPGNTECPQSDPCTWTEILSAFPNAQLWPGSGYLWLKAGGPWSNFDGNADALTIGVNTINTTYDFEPRTLYVSGATIPMHGATTFDVPVMLASGNSDLSAVSFTAAWDQSCVTYNSVAASLPNGFAVNPEPNATGQQVTILVNPTGAIPLPTLDDGVLVTLKFNAAACDVPATTGGTLPVSFTFPSSSQPSVIPSFGNNMGQPVPGTAAGGVVTLDFNDAPTNISLTNNKVDENAADAEVGTLCTADVDGSDCPASPQVGTFTYELVNNSTVCANSAGFNIVGNVLKTDAGFNREASGGYYHNICVRSTDENGLFVDKGFTIEVLNVNEGPDAINDGDTTPLIARGGTPLVINVLANDTDPDVGDTLSVVIPVSNIEHGTVDITHSGHDVTYTASDDELTDSANVSLNVVANDTRGDCNADGQIDAADFPATVLEIFDNDIDVNGNNHIEWWLTYLPGFLGSPQGCDSNASENGPNGTAASVEAGDIICTVQIFFGNTNCTSVSAAATAEPATLSIARDLQGATGDTVAIPVTLATAGNRVAAATFALTFDGDAASFDPTDSDADGVPDAVTLNVPAGVAKTVIFDAATNRIQVAVYGTALPMPLLSDGVLATVDLQVTGEASSLTLTQTSLGNDAGQSIPVIVDGGTTPLVGGDGELFIPLLNTK